jgi:AcrR family transcriptional regulator
LVDAGLDLLGGVRLADVLAAVETRAIAEAAGVTTGSFFHHFRDRDHFAQAVVDRWVQRWQARVERLAGLAADSSEHASGQTMRETSAVEWASLARPGEVEAVQHLLWALRHQPIAAGSSRTAGEVLEAAYQQLSQAVCRHYERTLRGMGREPIPPFSAHDVEVLSTAVADGLQLRSAADPGAIRDGLYVDAITTLAVGATRPVPDRSGREVSEELVDRARQLGRRTGSSTSDAGHEPPGGERWRAIADAAAHLFAHRSAAEVTAAEVAAAARVPVAVVRQEFGTTGTVSAVAAAGWARHLSELESVATDPDGADHDPVRRIEAVLHRLVEIIHAERWATASVVAQTIVDTTPGRSVEGRSLVERLPVAELLRPHVERLRDEGRLDRRIRIGRLSRSIVHLATMQALLFPEESPARVVDEVMTMVFDGALVPPSDA